MSNLHASLVHAVSVSKTMRDNRREAMSKQALSPVVSPLVGALAGGALGGLVHAIRPHDKDENKKRSLMMHILAGTLAGAAGGYGMSQIFPGDAPSRASRVAKANGSKLWEDIKTRELPDSKKNEFGKFKDFDDLSKRFQEISSSNPLDKIPAGSVIYLPQVVEYHRKNNIPFGGKFKQLVDFGNANGVNYFLIKANGEPRAIYKTQNGDKTEYIFSPKAVYRGSHGLIEHLLGLKERLFPPKQPNK